ASWEDPANITGCSWITQFKAEVSNLLFERLCIYFCLVGFQRFNCNGIKINVRRGQVKFTIWSGNVPAAVDGAAVMDELQQAFGLDFEIDFIYKNHKVLLDRVTQYSPVVL
ncbi:translation initiation factor 4E, partial [Pancytospora philotis]